MSKDLVLEPTADEAADIEAALQELLAEIRHANEEMARDQQEIDRLKAQTREVLTRLQAA